MKAKLNAMPTAAPCIHMNTLSPLTLQSSDKHLCVLQFTALHVVGPQLPHSYYFTTRVLVLKFANKGVFFEEIHDSYFPRKRGYFGTYLCEFGEKGVNFDVQCFAVKMGGSFGLKSQSFIAKKGVRFGLKSLCFIAKKVSF